MTNLTDTKRMRSGIGLNNIASSDDYQLQHKSILTDLFSKTFMSRSYELPSNAMFLVFNPIKEHYDGNYDFFNSKKFIDSVEKYIKYKFKPDYYIITREIQATNIHLNVYLITQEQFADVSSLNGAVNGKYALWASIKDTYHETRNSIILYIFKEALKRKFDRYLDYHYAMNS